MSVTLSLPTILSRLTDGQSTLEADGATVVIDPLADAGAVFAWMGEGAADIPVPEIVAPSPGAAVAGLVTHLHRDHADAPR